MKSGEKIGGWPLKLGVLSKPLVIAHRGDVESAPENTLEAFRGVV